MYTNVNGNVATDVCFFCIYKSSKLFTFRVFALATKHSSFLLRIFAKFWEQFFIFKKIHR